MPEGVFEKMRRLGRIYFGIGKYLRSLICFDKRAAKKKLVFKKAFKKIQGELELSSIIKRLRAVDFLMGAKLS